MARIIPKPKSTSGGGGAPDPHAFTHISGGSDEIDGDRLDVDYSPTNYTPIVTAPATALDQLTAHLAGIDAALTSSGDELVKISATDTTAGYLEDKLVAATGTPLFFTVINGGGDEDLELSIDADNLTIDFSPTNYTPDDSIGEADAVTDLSAHLAGIDNFAGTAIVGPGPTVPDFGIVVFDGTGGYTVQENGLRNYGSSATDPVSPSPSDGDIYYNTSLRMQMEYDGLRSKWLSTETATFMFGRNGNVSSGQYYRGINGRVLSSSIGFYGLRNGTIVSIAYSRTDSDAATFGITASGTTIATLASSATSGRQLTTDADFSFGSILAARNEAGSAPTSNVQGWVRIKWRI